MVTIFAITALYVASAAAFYVYMISTAQPLPNELEARGNRRQDLRR